MSLKRLQLGILLGVSLAAVGCGPARPKPDAGVDAGGNNGNDAGNVGGSDGGVDGGIREVTIDQAKNATFCTENLRLRGVVVVAVDDSYKGSQGDYDTQFWVVDPANPTDGIMVDKFFTDTPGTYNPQVGDVLDIDGYLGTESKYEDRIGYRFIIKSQFGCQAPANGMLKITKVTTATPPNDNTAPSGFGNAQGGTVKANPELAGTRVHVPGPLTLTDPNPPAFKRVSNKPGDTVHFGFEVTGGILVNNYKTFGTTEDGGTERCDYRAFANDGGTVTFPNGIRGVWDSFTHAPCADGGTSLSCYKNAGHIPGTDAGYTFVLYPQDCANDFAGALVQ